MQKSESEVKGKFLLSLASTYENFLKTDQEIVIKHYVFEMNFEQLTISFFFQIKVKNYYKKSIELIPKENLPRYKLAEYQS